MKTWRERIAEGIANGNQWVGDDVRARLRDYNCCLVGEQRERHPEVVVYLPANGVNTVRPADAVLLELGNRAPWATPKEADRLLDQIEDRVLQLKREQRTA